MDDIKEDVLVEKAANGVIQDCADEVETVVGSIIHYAEIYDLDYETVLKQVVARYF